MPNVVGFTILIVGLKSLRKTAETNNLGRCGVGGTRRPLAKLGDATIGKFPSARFKISRFDVYDCFIECISAPNRALAIDLDGIYRPGIIWILCG